MESPAPLARARYALVRTNREYGLWVNLALLMLVCVMWLQGFRPYPATTVSQRVVEIPRDVSLTNAVEDDDEDIRVAENEYPVYEKDHEEDVEDESEPSSAPTSPQLATSALKWLCRDGKLNPEMFEDPEAYRKAEYFKIHTPLSKTTGMHWATEAYEKAFLKNPPKKIVPRLKVELTQDEFVECFMNYGFPVILNMDAFRSRGFKTPHYDSVDDMLKDFPADPKLRGSTMYKANKLLKGTPDLGPALEALKYNEDKKMTKRWVLSPPTEARFLKARCSGGLCWSKAAFPFHPSKKPSVADETLMKETQYLVVDVHAGEMLFLPAAWAHAVYNLKPTVSIVQWVSSGPSQLYVNVTGLTGGRSARRNAPCLKGQTKC